MFSMSAMIKKPPFGFLAAQKRHTQAAAAARFDKQHAKTTTAPIKTSLVVGVLGAKGGVGSTTTAVNLTAMLAQLAGSASMIDANLQQPDAAVMLGREVKYGLLELLERTGDIEPKVVSACSVPISESVNCSLISPPLSGEAGIKAHATNIADCVQSLRACAPCWVIDLSKYLDRHLVSLMDKCDQLVLLLEPTLASVGAAKRWLKIFRELGYSEEKVVCVINRSGGKVKLVEEQLDELAPFGEIFRIPNAFELIELSAARGEPAVLSNPRAGYSAAVRKLAEHLLQRTR